MAAVSLRRGSTTIMRSRGLAACASSVRRMRRKKDRMRDRRIGAGDQQAVGKADVLIRAWRRVGSERLLVARHRRRHAEARAGVDVVRADQRFCQLAEDVVVLGQQLVGNVEGNAVRPALPSNSSAMGAGRRAGPPCATASPWQRRARSRRAPLGCAGGRCGPRLVRCSKHRVAAGSGGRGKIGAARRWHVACFQTVIQFRRQEAPTSEQEETRHGRQRRQQGHHPQGDQGKGRVPPRRHRAAHQGGVFLRLLCRPLRADPVGDDRRPIRWLPRTASRRAPVPTICTRKCATRSAYSTFSASTG